MKKILYYILLLGVSYSATAQLKNTDKKWKNNFLQRMYQNQKFGNYTQIFRSKKINPYWLNVDAPHFRNSYSPQVKVPTFNSVWTHIGFDSLGNDTKWFLRTADGGKTWRFDTIKAPDGYVIGSISPVDGNICYASMYNQNTGLGGGIFKTTDGGATWKQIGSGKLFNANSFPDFVSFFDAKHGLAVGDANGPGIPYMEIYTTDDAGATWARVPRENIPPNVGTPYSFDFQVYTVFENRIWFRGYDSEGNSYVYRSDDLGHHWQLFSFPGQYFDYAFSDKSNGLATYQDETGHKIAASHDGGKTWADVNHSGYPKDFIAAIPGTHTFVTTAACCDETNGGSSYSNDYGATWKLIDSGANAVHTDVAFLNPLVGWTGAGFDPDLSGGIFKWKLHFPFLCNSFAATHTNKNVLLNWQVENDRNNYYSVERSADGISFSEIGQVKSKDNLNENQAYNFEDNSSLFGQQYYRLKQVDNDGSISYSSIAKVDLGNPKMLRLYPNPAKDKLTIEGLSPLTKTTLSIIDVSGKLIRQLNITDKSYTYNLQQLTAGSYYLKVEADKKVITLKFVKE